MTFAEPEPAADASEHEAPAEASEPEKVTTENGSAASDGDTEKETENSSDGEEITMQELEGGGSSGSSEPSEGSVDSEYLEAVLQEVKVLSVQQKEAVEHIGMIEAFVLFFIVAFLCRYVYKFFRIFF